ncbi:MAG: hypothetical protein ABR595_05960 [Psychroflexus sp.]
MVWVPKYPLRILKGDIKELVSNDIRMLCEWKGYQVQKMIFKKATFTIWSQFLRKFEFQN